MSTIHIISHTHWDREWYLPFQVFRLKLVHLVDGLLDLLQSDPDFKYFMLDGQTIVLDDYLWMRPDRENELRALVQSGQLLIGPWHILPDEFLVSPEATIRNLLQGDRMARRFGPKMEIGYIPDPFGHIGQMPQILRGFGIESASVQRGLSDEPCEFWWQAPDGSRVFMAFLRDGYGNASALPAALPDSFLAEVQRLGASLAPHTASSHLLLMQGTDHMEPVPETPALIAYANERLADGKITHSTLPDYLQAVRSEVNGQDLQTIAGELRSSKRFHLLPAVLSSRMWIKQRNHACETLLEKWVEPFTTFAQLARKDSPLAAGPSQPATPVTSAPLRIKDPAPLVRQAWRLLMECHPHDSICGCSIDQVHDEMRPRFDQVAQICEELLLQSLEALTGAIDTTFHGVSADREEVDLDPSPSSTLQSLVVFNPLAFPRSELVQVSMPLPSGQAGFEILDHTGRTLPNRRLETTVREIANLSLDKDQFQSLLGGAQGGSVAGFAIQGVRFRREGDTLHIDLELDETGVTRPEVIESAMPVVLEALVNPALTRFLVMARARMARIEFRAEDLPSCGYKTFWARPLPGSDPTLDLQETEAEKDDGPVENEFFILEVSPKDGSLTLTDKRSGAVFAGLNRFVDGGDRGDEYNYCPPEMDHFFEPEEIQRIMVDRDGVKQSVEVRMQLQTPAGLTEDRQARQEETLPIQIVTRYTLAPGVPRVDIHTQVNNTAQDHRLRVHFPAPFQVEAADYDGHFEVVRRLIGLPPHDHTWAEQPRPEQPQRAFTSITGGKIGLVVANRGLPEVEVLQPSGGDAQIALTLLRCTGWLSRDDLSNRKGHAGPGLPTPGAQMPGIWEFDYTIIPVAGLKEKASIQEILPAYQQAQSFNVPVRGIAGPGHEGSLPGSGSFLEISPPSFVLSAVKAAEDGRGWIVRGYNLGPDLITVRVKPWRGFSHAARTDLAEVDQSELAVGPDGAVETQVRGHEIATFRFSD